MTPTHMTGQSLKELCRLGPSYIQAAHGVLIRIYLQLESAPVFSPEVNNEAFLLALSLVFRAPSGCSSNSPLFLSVKMMEQGCLETLSHTLNGNYQSVRYVHLHTRGRKLSFAADIN